MNQPSVKELMERLVAVEDSPTVAAGLRQLNAEVVVAHGQPAWPELLDAARRIEQLHLLAQQLLWNLRNWGTPPEAPPSAKVRAMSLPLHTRSAPMHLVRPASAPATVARTWTAAKAGRPPTEVSPGRVPEGMVGIEEVAQICCVAKTTLVQRIGAGMFPKHELMHGRAHYWRRTAIEAWHAAEQQRKAAARQVPDGMLTSEQVAARIGHRVEYLWHLLSKKGFPRAEAKLGLRMLWRPETVDAWQRQREAERNAPRPAPAVPKGWFTAKQLCAELDRSDAWLYQAMKHQGFPKPSSCIGRLPLWSEADVRAWITATPSKGKRNTRKRCGALDGDGFPS